MNTLTTAVTTLVLAILSLVGLRPSSVEAYGTPPAATEITADVEADPGEAFACSDGCAAVPVDTQTTGPGGIPYTFHGLHIPASVPWSKGKCVPNGTGCNQEKDCRLFGRLTIGNTGGQPIKAKGSNVNGEVAINPGGRANFDMQHSFVDPLFVECGNTAWLELTYTDTNGNTSTIKWSWQCTECN